MVGEVAVASAVEVDGALPEDEALDAAPAPANQPFEYADGVETLVRLEGVASGDATVDVAVPATPISHLQPWAS